MRASSNATRATRSISVARIAQRVDRGLAVGRRCRAARRSTSPPVSSRTTTRSVPRRTAGLSGPASSRPGQARAGRRFAKTPSSRRIASSAASGRLDGGRPSNAGSPTAPSSTASLAFAAASVSAGSGGRPACSAAPPIGFVVNVQVWPNTSATRVSVRTAAADDFRTDAVTREAGRCLPSHAESVAGFAASRCRGCRARPSTPQTATAISSRSSSETCFL